MDLLHEFGNIDIYLFDQLLRGRIAPGMRVFDAGCGGGRNLVYLLRQGYDVAGSDADAGAIAQVRLLASTAPKLAGDSASEGGPPTHDFRIEAIEQTSFSDASFDVVIASAVLHFAREAAHFDAMLNQLWRVLKPGGLFFARLASTIGIEDDVQSIDDGSASAAKGRSGATAPKLVRVARASDSGRFRLPDGSDRFLVDAAAIEAWTARLGGTLLDPIKTTVVQDQRSMTTWVARKR